MAGFANDVVFGTNVDFTGTKPVSGQINQDGELLIGAASAPFIRSGFITVSGGLTTTVGPGTINIDGSNIRNGPYTPNAFTVNAVLYGNGGGPILNTNVLANAALITSAGSVPTLSQTLPSAVQGNITSVGTISSGTWNGSVIDVAHGGTGVAAITAHDLIIGNGTSAVTLLAPSATSGIPLISQGSSSDPAYGTAVVAGGGTGVATFANTSALLTTGTTATGALQNIASVATGQVLTSAGTSTLPAWSAAPSLTSITFPSAGGSGSATTDTLGFYEDGTWTPTVTGAGTAGTTTYTTQVGIYTRIGNRVFAQGQIVITAATGTGAAVIGGFPFNFSSQANFNYSGNIQWSAAGWSWPASKTMLSLQGVNGQSNAQVTGQQSAGTQSFLQMSNAAATIIFTIVYRA